MNLQSRENLLANGQEAWSRWRSGFNGTDAIAGIIMACISNGETSQAGIISTVASISGCSKLEVKTILYRFNGSDQDSHLWNRAPYTGYSLLKDADPNVRVRGNFY